MRRTKLILAAAAVLGLLLLVMLYIAVSAGSSVSESAASTEAARPDEAAEQETTSAEEEAEAASQEETAGLEARQTEQPQTEQPQAAEPVRLVFAGDVYLSEHVLSAYDRAGTIRGVVDEALQQKIDDADFFMVNEEFPFSTRGSAAEDKQYTFRVDPERAALLKEMGIDLVTLANNHALDFGTDALLDTCDTLDQAGILHVGAGRNVEEAKRPVIREIKGQKIAFLGASRVFPVSSWRATQANPGMLTAYDPAELEEEIAHVREDCDYIVVYVHWGIERKERPEEYQRTLGKALIDAGADLVIGSHPHVLQGIEYYKGKPIVYSLGNFVFGSSIPRTALLTVTWDGTDAALSLTPASSSGGYTQAVTDLPQQQAFYAYMTELSYGVTVDEGGRVSEAE